MIRSVKVRYIFSKIEINSIINFILLFTFIQCSKNDLSANNFEELERVQEENQNNSEKRYLILRKLAVLKDLQMNFHVKIMIF